MDVLEGVTFKSLIIMPSETDVAPGAMFVLQFLRKQFQWKQELLTKYSIGLRDLIDFETLRLSLSPWLKIKWFGFVGAGFITLF